MSMLLTGQNGTRFHPPEPFMVLYANCTPENTPPLAVLTLATVAEVGCAEAMVVMAESSQPFARYRAAADLLAVNVGDHRKFTTARCRWSSGDVPLSSP